MLRRIFKIAFFAVTIFMVLLIAALIFFSSSPGENFIKSQLENRISDQLELKASIGQFETNLFSRVQLNKITFITPSTPGFDSLLYVDNIKVTYSILELLSGGIDLKSVIIDNVNLNISADSLGNYGIPVLDQNGKADTAGGETSISISVDSIALTDINASYNDKRIPINVSLYNLSSRINGRGKTEYEGTLSADSISALYEGEPFLTKNLSCELSWDGIRLSVVSTAEIEMLDLAVSASLNLPDFNDLSLNASLKGDPSSVVGKFKDEYNLPDIEMNEIEVNVAAKGDVESPDITLNVLSNGGRVQNISLGELRLDAGYSSDTVRIDSALVKSLGGSIRAKGFISLTDTATATVDADLLIKGLDLARLWPAIYGDDSPFAGNLDGSIRAKGMVNTTAGWDINGNLKLSELLYLEYPTDDLSLDFSVHNNIARMLLVHAGDTVSTTATLNNGNIEGEFSANFPRISSISRFADLPDLKGNVTAGGTFGGSLDNPFITARLNGSMISYQNFPVDSLAADIVYRDSSFIINGLKISGSRPESDMYESILGEDSLWGHFNYSCDLKGSSDSLEGEISAQIYSLRYSGFDVDSVFAFANVDGSIIKLSNLDIYYKDLEAKMSGSYDTVSANGVLKTDIYSESLTSNNVQNEDISVNKGRPGRGTVIAEFSLLRDNNVRLDINGDSLWVELLGYFVESDIPESGFLNLNLSFEGSPARPTGSLSAKAYSLTHPSYEIDSVIVAAELDNEHLRLDEFRLFAYGNSIYGRTDIYFDRGPDNNLIFNDETAIYGEVILDSLELSILKPYISPNGELHGTTSANIAWDGTVKNPGLVGWINISNGYLMLAERSSTLDQIHVGLSISDSILSIDTASFYSGGTPLSIKGFARYDLEGNYDISMDLRVRDIGLLNVRGGIQKDSLDIRIFSDNFHLYVLKPFLAFADSLGGELESEVLITGKTATPEFLGFLRVTGLSLRSSQLSTDIKSGLIDVKFDKSRIDLDTIFAEVNGGTININGYLIHDAGELTDLNLGLKASNIVYEKKGVFKSKLQFADLSYVRKEDRYSLDGDISFGESRLTLKFPLKSILPWAQSVETVEYEFPDIIARTGLNVRIRENDDLWIDNNLANIRMNAELSVIGTPVRPNFAGMVNIQEGYLIYLDNRFMVEEGTLIFSDPLKFNPEINLLAETQVTEYQRTVAQKYTVYIKVEGNLENLRPDIYSEPPLDKADIIALLTLRTTRSRLVSDDENQGGIRNVLVDRASRLTSNRVSGYLSEKVTSIFGFDEFTVEGNLFQFGNSWGPRVVASTNITQKVKLTYSTTVGHLNDQGVRLGYQWKPRISIQGETDQTGRSGIDIRYGLKFK